MPRLAFQRIQNETQLKVEKNPPSEQSDSVDPVEMLTQFLSKLSRRRGDDLDESQTATNLQQSQSDDEMSDCSQESE